MRFACVASVIGALLTAACSTLPAPTGPDAPVPVANFVNSLKCEYAKFLSNYRGQRLRLVGWTVTGSMELNVVSDNTTTGGVGISSLVPFQGASIDFGLTSSVERKLTTDTKISFTVESKAANSHICRVAGRIFVSNGLGFGEWLTDLAKSLDSAAAGDPKFGVAELDYQLIFAVTQSVSANGDIGISIIPLKVSASALASRNDVQTIMIKMVPPNVVVGHNKDGTPITKPGVHPFTVPINPNTLSPMLVPGGGAR